MTKKSTTTPLERWHNEMARHIAATIKSFSCNKLLSESQIDVIGDKILIDQTRYPWPGALLTNEKKNEVKVSTKKNLRFLLHSVKDEACQEIASRIAGNILRALSAAQISSNLLSESEERSAHLEHVIRQEFYLRRSSEETVSRGIQRYLREKSSASKNKTEIETKENDPLRDLLGLPRIGRSMLPNEDIRVHMAKYLIANPKLSSLLSSTKKSNSDILGEEFSGKCTIGGFADKARHILLIEVATPLIAQEISFQKRLFLRRVNAISGFESVKDLKFLISQKHMRR